MAEEGKDAAAVEGADIQGEHWHTGANHRKPGTSNKDNNRAGEDRIGRQTHPSLTNITTIGICATAAGLIYRIGTQARHVHKSAASQITTKRLTGTIGKNIGR